MIAKRVRTLGIAAAATLAGAAAVCAGAGAAKADDPDFLAFGGGYFDWNRQKAPAAEFRLEYRSDRKLGIFKPLGGIMGTSDGAVYAFAGVGVDVFLGRRIVLTPSFALGYYEKGSGLDLGHELEFRSQIEFAYRFDDRSRLGLAVSHMSNASIANENPGTESAILYYAMPLSRIFGE